MYMMCNSYPKTRQALEAAMKVAQRELPDEKLKVEVLESLVVLRDKVNGSKPNKE